MIPLRDVGCCDYSAGTLHRQVLRNVLHWVCVAWQLPPRARYGGTTQEVEGIFVVAVSAAMED